LYWTNAYQDWFKFSEILLAFKSTYGDWYWVIELGGEVLKQEPNFEVIYSLLKNVLYIFKGQPLVV